MSIVKVELNVDQKTVGDLKRAISNLPEDMPLFMSSDYYGYHEPIFDESAIPVVSRFVEVEFLDEGRRGFYPHDYNLETLVDNKVLRYVDALDMGCFGFID